MNKNIVFLILLVLTTLSFSQFSSKIDYSDNSSIQSLEKEHFIEVKPILNQKSVNWEITLEDSNQVYNSSFDATQFGLELNYSVPIENYFNFEVKSSLTSWSKSTDMYYKSLETGLNDTIFKFDDINFNDYSLSFILSDFEKDYLVRLGTKLMDYNENKNYLFYSFYGEYNIINELLKKSRQRLGFNFEYIIYDKNLIEENTFGQMENIKAFSSYYDFKPTYSVGLKYKKIEDELTYNFSSTYFAFPDSLYRSSTGLNLELGVDYKLKESSLKFSVDLGTNIGMDFNDDDFVLYDKAIPSYYYSIGAGSFLFSKNLYLQLKWRYSEIPLLSREVLELNNVTDQSIIDLLGDFEEAIINNNIIMSFKYFFR